MGIQQGWSGETSNFPFSLIHTSLNFVKESTQKVLRLCHKDSTDHIAAVEVRLLWLACIPSLPTREKTGRQTWEGSLWAFHLRSIPNKPITQRCLPLFYRWGSRASLEVKCLGYSLSTILPLFSTLTKCYKLNCMPPKFIYRSLLTPSTSKCDCIWK